MIATQSNQVLGTSQIVVSNPSLAQQIVQGKVQVATIGGQQVLIRPTGNNQAQVVAQLTPSTLAQSMGGVPTLQATSPVMSPVKQVLMQQQQPTPPPEQIPAPEQTQIAQPQQFVQQTQPVIAQQPQPILQTEDSVEQSLLAGQPPGTVIKCVTAQVIQTNQGPRIVLQGLQGADFTPQQLAAVQQQVKQQLLKGECLEIFCLAHSLCRTYPKLHILFIFYSKLCNSVLHMLLIFH